MHLRDTNIIVCDCGAELNPDIVTDHDFITYADGVATCSNCLASEEIEFPQSEPIVLGPTLDERIDACEDVLLFLI